ncbi:MAG: N-acetylmuramoyl-L-alanine amidase [Lachnospiraceae bacterium]|nr:N-acetylmuramoyl-L-alanine amidase [Lachnospiraceae bacterium]
MLIALDAGHGGSDPGAVYNGRNEKDDNLRLALAVGDILKNKGVDVVYTRTTDIYETPFKKATDANEAGADYFVSFHRNSGENPNTASGAQTLIYSGGGEKEKLARNIQNNLIEQGFKDLGIVERPNLVVLKRTKMPAVLIETGFINNDKDNAKFDDDFDAIANAIAAGILATIDYDTVSAVPVRTTDDMPDDPYAQFEDIKDEPDDICDCSKLYRVQIGAFRNRDNAERLLNSALADGFPAFIIYSDDLYKVQVGAFRNLDNAVRMERRLRRFRYNTFITT